MHLATAKLTIANGASDSGSLGDFFGANPAKVALDNAQSVTISAPAALTGVVTVQVAPYPGGTWTTLVDDAGDDVTVVAAKTQRVALNAGFKDLRLHSAGTEGAARDFYVQIQEDMS